MKALCIFQQIFVDQLCGDVIAVTRHNPQTHNSVVLIARMVWSKHHNIHDVAHFRPVEVQGKECTSFQFYFSTVTKYIVLLMFHLFTLAFDHI